MSNVPDSGLNDERKIYDRLVSVERHSEALERWVGQVSETLEKHGRKLDDMADAIAHQKPFDPKSVLQFLALSVTIGAAFTATVIYLATNINEPRLAVLEYRMQQMERSIEWKPTLETTRPNALR